MRRSKKKRATRDILEIGEKLNEIKTALEHSQFLAWVRSEFDWTERTANNYMNAASAFVGIKSETVFDLTVSSVYELARMVEPVRSAVIQKIEADRPTTDGILALVENAKQKDRGQGVRKTDAVADRRGA
ncbi:DUF3102 domain-containing protein [Mesorhizobium sp. IMUNJ 23232]|uniref:DUF3102 domain-containing protein n=1 Tax=Mesorhizobium sp. IMUNJ 23232 TaxID=3376064 RepID=UPI0037B0079E